MSHRVLQITCIQRLYYFPGHLNMLSDRILKGFCPKLQLLTREMSSNVHPTDTSQLQRRPKSKFHVVNWFYDGILKGNVKLNSFYQYAEITKQVNYLQFFKVFQLEDTFNSWFLITELHVWMLMARLRPDGKEGRIASNSLVAAMWDDTNARAKVLSPGNVSTSRKQITILAQEFRASLLIYDEGLLSSDTVLASALWYRFLSQSCDDPRLIELLVAYVREQIFNLENTSKDDLFLRAGVKWKPLPLHLLKGKMSNVS